MKVLTNVTGTWTLQKFGDATHQVTNVALDMKDGNDFVDVSSLRAARVLVGEGNGNDFVHVGDTLAGGLITGSGQNVVCIGGGSTTPFASFGLPNTAGSAVFLGWGYNFQNGGRDLFTSGAVGNTNATRMKFAALLLATFGGYTPGLRLSQFQSFTTQTRCVPFPPLISHPNLPTFTHCLSRAISSVG